MEKSTKIKLNQKVMEIETGIVGTIADLMENEEYSIGIIW